MKETWWNKLRNKIRNSGGDGCITLWRTAEHDFKKNCCTSLKILVWCSSFTWSVPELCPFFICAFAFAIAFEFANSKNDRIKIYDLNTMIAIEKNLTHG
jgi:hypothetical protein